MRWYGIDFSGNHTQWRPNVMNSNVWVATLEDGGTGLQLILDSADALDAVICGFAAIAVTRGTITILPIPIAVDEGWIAIHP